MTGNVSGLTYETWIAKSAPATPAKADETPNASVLYARRADARGGRGDLAVADRRASARPMRPRTSSQATMKRTPPSPRPRSRASAAVEMSQPERRLSAAGRFRPPPPPVTFSKRFAIEGSETAIANVASASETPASRSAGNPKSEADEPGDERRERDREHRPHPVAERKPARRVDVQLLRAPAARESGSRTCSAPIAMNAPWPSEIWPL